MQYTSTTSYSHQKSVFSPFVQLFCSTFGSENWQSFARMLVRRTLSCNYIVDYSNLDNYSNVSEVSLHVSYRYTQGIDFCLLDFILYEADSPSQLIACKYVAFHGF